MECKRIGRKGDIIIVDNGMDHRAIIMDEKDQRELIKFFKKEKPMLFIDAICEV